jgi:hypothetical protein
MKATICDRCESVAKLGPYGVQDIRLPGLPDPVKYAMQDLCHSCATRLAHHIIDWYGEEPSSQPVSADQPAKEGGEQNSEDS